MNRTRIQLRLSLAMAVVAYPALCLAAIRNPYRPQLSYLFGVTAALLFASLLRARTAETPGGRAWWGGVSVFGWLYLLTAGSEWRDLLPTTSLAEALSVWLTIHYGPFPTPAGRGPWYTDAMHITNTSFCIGSVRSVELGLTFVFAGVGGVLSLLWGAVHPPASTDAEAEGRRV